HDRAFINDVATRIIELNSHGIKEYGGNYDFYKNQKKSESFAEMKLYSDYIDEKNKIRNALKKQKSLASGSRKIKTTDNEKMCRDKRAESSQHTFAKRAKAIESRLSQLQKIEKPHSDKSYRVYINGGVHDDKLVLGLTDLDVGYGKCIVAKSINFEIRGPSRTQIMGPNGSGKTTLFRTIMGQMDPIEGDIKVGDGVNAGYFSQDVDSLDHTKNAIYNLSSNGEDRADLRKWLHMLGIQGDDVNKSTGDLSRGQRSKLGIARLLSGNYQLIILDEPTNHLDIATRESIEFSLSKYQGAILFASHDDYFAKKLNPTQLVKLGIN
ncbi:ABC-F family ATP-binding cassette domain-containing protein, partial [Candidatus Saccharibacteria bacterium]|nr:ABC-F family ATP-binding cassette domain-containing protein [Candidatus Saccharibacteria bacterium]